MQALAIVTCTLLGLGVVLFGSDALDRRLTLRSDPLRADLIGPEPRPSAPLSLPPASAAAATAAPEVVGAVEAAAGALPTADASRPREVAAASPHATAA